MRPIHAPAALALVTALMLGATGCAPSTAPDTTPGSDSTASAAPITAPVDAAACPALPDGFAYLNTVDPTIEIELRYATTNNFTGTVVDGYESANAPILRDDAAEALSEVQSALAAEGLGLLVYDAFRPTRSVAAFVAWSQTDDDRTQAEYYPTFEKPELFELGYIAEQSGHSLGGTVDLTLVDLDTGTPLDMGGAFDLFDTRSHYAYDGVSDAQFANRTLLREAMISAGFAPYAQEWWHFSYPVPEGAERLDFALEPCG